MFGASLALLFLFLNGSKAAAVIKLVYHAETVVDEHVLHE